MVLESVSGPLVAGIAFALGVGALLILRIRDRRRRP